VALWVMAIALCVGGIWFMLKTFFSNRPFPQ
jgi:hypothetical protein